MQQMIFIADFIACSTCFGKFYAHHQELHKPDIPIRPVVNNRSAPAYKTAKKLNNILKQHLHLNNYYTINNSTELAQNLTRLAFCFHITLAYVVY